MTSTELQALLERCDSVPRGDHEVRALRVALAQALEEVESGVHPVLVEALVEAAGLLIERAKLQVDQPTFLVPVEDHDRLVDVLTDIENQDDWLEASCRTRTSDRITPRSTPGRTTST